MNNQLISMDTIQALFSQNGIFCNAQPADVLMLAKYFGLEDNSTPIYEIGAILSSSDTDHESAYSSVEAYLVQLLETSTFDSLFSSEKKAAARKSYIFGALDLLETVFGNDKRIFKMAADCRMSVSAEMFEN